MNVPACEFWTADAPCGAEAVETLVLCNPLCGGVPRVPGQIDCCASHLAEFMVYELLAADGTRMVVAV